MDTRKKYPSDLTDLQWNNIEHLFPRPRAKAGRPRTYPVREIVDAVFYLARSGCAWRMFPHDFPPWKTVSYYFYTWRNLGVWERIHHVLRVEHPHPRRPGADAFGRGDRQPVGQDDRVRRPQGVQRGEKKSAAASGTSSLTPSA